MSTDYNSKLIASLYEETDEEKATEIADEMTEIGDPIFIQPIFAAYKRFLYTTVSHYFLSNLKKFKTPETTEIFKGIAMSDNTKETNFHYCLDYFNEIEYVEPWLTSKAYSGFLEAISYRNGDVYNLNIYIKYLSMVKPPIPLKPFLITAFEDESKNSDVRTLVLQYFLRENSKDNLKYYFDNFDKIKGKKSEIIFTKEILGWKDGIIPILKEKILKEGSTYAREIIETKNKKEQKNLDEKEKSIEIKYNNAQIITEISKLRSKINIFASGDARFGFSIFPPSELIYQQTEGAEDKQKLVGYCMELRSFLQELDKENLSKHNFSVEETRELISGMENITGSINLLHLYLLSKKIETKEDLFGLRKLNQIVAKLAHPDETTELIKLLKENNLFEMYKDGNFQGLHRKLLENYRDFLKLLFEGIKKQVK